MASQLAEFWQAGLARRIENDYHLQIGADQALCLTAGTTRYRDIAMRITLPLRIFAVAALLALSGLFAGQAALADDPVAVSVVIKDHKFEPAEISVPAGKTIRLTVQNEDATPEEFESHDLNLEKIVTGGSSIVLEFGPLKAGSYDFVGEFNEDSAKGRIVAE